MLGEKSAEVVARD